MKPIYRKLRRRNVVLDHVCEVGVYLPETSNVGDFIRDGIRATLVEANPELAEAIEAYFAGYNINVHLCAVWDWNGTVGLEKASASAFVADLGSSPAIANDGYTGSESSRIEVESRVFSELDDGSIDLLSVDIEGGEWYVIKHMRSRPKVISLETHFKSYVNPFIGKITAWMREHDYRVWYRDMSDTVFVRRDVFEASLADRALLVAQDVRIAIKRLRDRIRKRWKRSG
jgi:FkbM family methyltransferase